MSEVKTRFVIPNARLSFPHLWKKATFDGNPTNFEATLLIPKDRSDTLALIKQKIEDKLVDKFQTKDKVPKSIYLKSCFRDGDSADYDGYADHFSFKAANKMQPSIRTRDKKAATEDMNLFYAGCYVDAVVDVWIQDHPKYGKRINANLLSIRFREDGDPFTAGRVPDGVEDDFDDLEPNDEDLDELTEDDI